MIIEDQIKATILSHLCADEGCLIGIEVECLFYDHTLMRLPVNPCECFSSTSFINQLEELQKNDPFKAFYSLEPGGQLEWASHPVTTLHRLKERYDLHYGRIKTITEINNLFLIDFAVDPIFTPNLVELINSEKYRLMHRRFSETGEYGPWMMRNTASVQVNIDYPSEDHAERMAFAADCIDPLSSMLFANSPFVDGKPSGTKNVRHTIWNNTDNSRCQNLFEHGIHTYEGLVDRYIEFVQSIPVIFITDDKGDPVKYEGTYGDWFKALDAKGQLTDEQIQIALHQIFTNVRFKDVLEIRGSDRPPLGHELAPAAFWVGLLMSEKALQETIEIVNNWSGSQRSELILSAETLDFKQSGPGGKSIYWWLEKFSDIALVGLAERSAILNIPSEKIYLESFVDRVLHHGPFSIQAQNKIKDSGISIQEYFLKSRK
jgi:glutamate--cysteine ligase